jgi:hypothetical protein
VPGPWQTSAFEANITVPLQMRIPPRLHIPLPPSKREGVDAAASAMQDRVKIREAGVTHTSPCNRSLSVSLTIVCEAGCDCVVWPPPASESLREFGVLSVELVTSAVASRLGQGTDTVVLELAAGSFSFHLSAR